jgi:hypothetical protein
VSTARVFGLVETNREQISLTALGRQIVNPEREHQARVKAFLNVPLYRAMFDNYRGCPLPRNIAIENEMVRLGVSAKQKEKARQVFQRSAEQAGFFAYGRDKLVMPSGVAVGEAPAATPPPADDFRARGATDYGTGGGSGGSGRASGPGGSGGGAGSRGGTDLHPFIQGLLVTLPPRRGVAGRQAGAVANDGQADFRPALLRLGGMSSPPRPGRLPGRLAPLLGRELGSPGLAALLAPEPAQRDGSRVALLGRELRLGRGGAFFPGGLLDDAVGYAGEVVVALRLA